MPDSRPSRLSQCSACAGSLGGGVDETKYSALVSLGKVSDDTKVLPEATLVRGVLVGGVLGGNPTFGETVPVP